MRTHNFLEVGAAALLVGDMEAKMKGQPWKYFGTADMPYLDQLLQPSSVTTIANSASARFHLRAITALKRSKAGPRQIWYALHSSQIIAFMALCLVSLTIILFALCIWILSICYSHKSQSVTYMVVLCQMYYICILMAGIGGRLVALRKWFQDALGFQVKC